jgi:hypothetical protein
MPTTNSLIMKKLALRFAFASIIASAFVMSSCDNTDSTPDAPQAAAPTSVTNVGLGASSDVTFAVTVPGGYQSSEATAQGGTATIKSQPDAGATSGNVVVTFVGGATAGAGSVSLKVTDKNSKTVTSTAVIALSATPPTEISAPITTNTTWNANTKYILKGNIYVTSGATLTIEPGTVILGDKVTKGALIISRGGKIMAAGTAAKPIIFSSSAPKNFRNYGDWGGLVLLGKAQNNQSADQKIEGISAATGDNGLYGGTADDDNSGVLQYVRIEFAGIALSTDNELNGLTFGSVGSGTTVDHIQVSYSGDDSYEWFGGTVNTNHLIAYRGWDDEFDTDFGYRGKNQFLVSFRDPNMADKSGSNGFESDNNAAGDTKIPRTAAVFTNVTFFGPYMYANTKATSSSDATPILNPANVNSNYKRGAHIRRNSALQVYNCVFAGANIDGIFFEQANAAAVFKGNYIGRISGNPLPTPVANTVDDSFNAANFFTENLVSDPKDKLDLSDLFAGMSDKKLWSLTSPTALLAPNSPLLTGAGIGVDLSTVGLPTTPGFDATVDYIGAFDATNNWAAESWTNYDPNGTEY